MDDKEKKIDLRIVVPEWVVEQLRRYYQYMFDVLYYTGIAKHFTFEEFLGAYLRSKVIDDLQTLNGASMDKIYPF